MLENVSNWIEYPLVSGLLLFNCQLQVEVARASIECFFDQSWPSKELVIFNTTQLKLNRWKYRKRCKELRLQQYSYDHAINTCVANSNGEWCANWMHDCWYDPNYLSMHMQLRDKQRPVVFKHARAYSLKQQNMCYLTSSSLVPCWSFYRHYPFNLRSEQPVLDQFSDRICVDNPAQLVVKFVREIV